MTQRPWLAPGLSPVGRAALLYDHADDAGVEVRHKRGGRSWSAPWGTVYLGLTADTPVTVESGVLAHELRHAAQQGRGWRAWWWALCYLVSPWRRRRVEVEAEAEECAAWLAMTPGPVDFARARMIADQTARALGGWRWPHMTGGSRGELLDRVADLAVAYVISARASDGDRPSQADTQGAAPDEHGG